MMEFLPALMIFTTVLSASFAFYRAVRFATVRQEVSRNLMMAAIANAGTLTTPAEFSTSAARSSFDFKENVFFTQAAIQGTEVLPVRNQQAIDSGALCFQVYPHRPGAQNKQPFLIEGFFGSPANPDQAFELTSRSTLYRGVLAANGFPFKCR
jgi:hypothetical protein